MGKETENTKVPASMGHKIGTVLGTILCILLVPVLVINIILIIHSFTNPNRVPGIGKFFPLIVLTDSMYPEIQSGDLILCRTEEPENIRVGDVIAFYDPAGNGTSIVTHSVAEITETGGQRAWITRGIANNTNDAVPVPADKLVGVYRLRVPGLGNAVLFMQTVPGLILCVGCPVLLLTVWDLLRRRRYEKSRQADAAALMRELQELRAEKAKQEEDHKV